jgi:hypothetical protein
MSKLNAKTWPERARALLLVPCALVALAGCGDSGADQNGASPGDSAEPSPSGPAEGSTGTLSFELKAAGDITLNKFDYVITGPNFSKTGSIDVTNSNTVSARIDALPAGSGYSVTVLGNSVGEPVAQCSGSASFDIVARTVKNVPISISCQVAHEDGMPPAVAAPLPRTSIWLCGLALLGLGVTLAKRADSKRTG